ncbi:hypothetical protein BGX27_001156 [Mortierella sp. AM989]|nr:hypothetical protein BGX27_001156 [Mortierella sp. AM989]
MRGVDRNLDTEELKKAIYDFKKGLFKNAEDASGFVLYRTYLPSNEYTSDREFSEDDIKDQKVMTGSISIYFPDGAEENIIHIIIKRPKEDISSKPFFLRLRSLRSLRSHGPMFPHYLTPVPFLPSTRATSSNAAPYHRSVSYNR